MLKKLNTGLRYLAAIIVLTIFGLLLGAAAVRAMRFEDCGGYYNYRHSAAVDCSEWGR